MRWPWLHPVVTLPSALSTRPSAWSSRTARCCASPDPRQCRRPGPTSRLALSSIGSHPRRRPPCLHHQPPMTRRWPPARTRSIGHVSIVRRQKSPAIVATPIRRLMNIISPMRPSRRPRATSRHTPMSSLRSLKKTVQRKSVVWANRKVSRISRSRFRPRLR